MGFEEIFSLGVGRGQLLGFREPPKTLYHYTSLQGFLGIVQSRSMWASNLRYLNDTTEAIGIWDFLRRRVEVLHARRKIPKDFSVEHFVKLLDAQRQRDIFVASFSEDDDSLGQWRAYAPDGAGVAIGFAARALDCQWVRNSDPAGEPRFTSHFLMRVEYPEAESDEFDDQIIRILKPSKLAGPVGELSPEDSAIISFKVFAWKFKHPAFQEEKEWRSIYIREPKTMPYQRFRIRGSLLVPYVITEINIDSRRKPIVDGDYIHEVVVGPSAHQELNVDSVKQFLDANGYSNVTVRPSRVPYRDW